MRSYCFPRAFPLALRFALAASFALLALPLAAQVNPELYSGLQWRNVGPFRAGRVASVTGVIGQPNVFYIGLPLGGIWKTVSGGMVWYPIFDSVQEADSVGAIAVAPSDPNIIYAGTGDLVTGGGINTGDGMYKSADAGKTWTHIGLQGTRHINAILVDPHNPDLVLVSAQGDLRHPSPDGGVYRSTDGGHRWTQVLHPDDSTGARDMAWAFDDPSVVFATTISDVGGSSFGPPPPGPNRTALYRSTNEGQSWTQVVSASLPKLTGRTAVAVAMHTDGQRVFWIGSEGLYRSDDQGATWRHMAAHDSRISGRAYICGVYVDPQSPDIVYTMSTSFYRSTDGGNTFESWKGAPGGDDNHVLWIDPTNGKRILLGSDQGATVSYDGGHTWSSWYNQSTDQVYRIATDNRYPYWVAASQQDSGTTMIRSRSPFGQITMITDWWLIPGSEFGSIAPDPLHPGVFYDEGYGPSGSRGSVVRVVQSTDQWENVSPNLDPNMHLCEDGNARRMFDVKWDPGALYMAYQCLMVTKDGGETWSAFSPDLTVAKGKATVACGAAPPPPPKPAQTGARPVNPFQRGPDISDFAISPVRGGVFWTVSSDGQVYDTMDNGRHWTNVTNFTDLPTGANEFVSVAPGLDIESAYVADDRHTEGDYAPYIWRTHDGGKSWTKIVNGLPTDDPTGDFVRVIRQDPEQRGLLFCGMEATVYVSFDDGDHWQSLRQNLPTTSIRDMAFHTADHMNDLVIGTYGRGIWILDDMSPLRQIARHAAAIAAVPAYLFEPGDAIRSRRNINWDTPIPPDIAHAQNPPFGAIIYYHLSRPPDGPITVGIYDSAGQLVRTLSSVPKPIQEPPPPVPSYWLATPESLALPTAVGTDRTHWDLRYDDPPAVNHDIENQMYAIPDQTTYGPHGPLALPGAYTVKLTVDGQTYSQPLTVMNDSRVGEGPAVMAALRAQHRLDMLAYDAMKTTFAANQQVGELRRQVTEFTSSNVPAVASAAKTLETSLTKLGGPAPGGSGPFRRSEAPSTGPVAFRTLNGNFDSLIGPVNIDMGPTQPQIQAWEGYCRQYDATLAAWNAVRSRDVVAFNTLLRQNGLQPVVAATTSLPDPSCTFSGGGGGRRKARR